MDTSDGRERLRRQVAGTVLDGTDPAAATEAAGFNTAVDPPPAAWSSRPRTPATSPRPSGTPASRGYR